MIDTEDLKEKNIKKACEMVATSLEKIAIHFFNLSKSNCYGFMDTNLLELRRYLNGFGYDIEAWDFIKGEILDIGDSIKIIESRLKTTMQKVVDEEKEGKNVRNIRDRKR